MMTSTTPDPHKQGEGPDYVWRSPELYIYQVLFSLLIIAIILLNLNVITLYSRMVRLVRQKIPNILLLNQALVDLLVGLSSILRIVCHSHKCARWLDNLKFFFLEYTTLLAIGVLLMGTLERYMSIKVPFQHRQYVTRGKVIIMMVCTWIITALPAIVYSSYVDPVHIIEVTQNYYIGTYVVLLLTLLVVFIILSLTYREIKASISRRINQDGNSKTNPVTSEAEKVRINKEEESQKKLNRVFAFMSIAYLVTIAPQIVGTLVLDSVMPRTKEAHTTINISKSAFHLIYIVSSLINPLLTIVGKPDYKKSFMELFGCKGNQENSTTTSKN